MKKYKELKLTVNSLAKMMEIDRSAASNLLEMAFAIGKAVKSGVNYTIIDNIHFEVISSKEGVNFVTELKWS